MLSPRSQELILTHWFPIFKSKVKASALLLNLRGATLLSVTIPGTDEAPAQPTSTIFAIGLDLNKVGEVRRRLVLDTFTSLSSINQQFAVPCAVLEHHLLAAEVQMDLTRTYSEPYL